MEGPLHEKVTASVASGNAILVKASPLGIEEDINMSTVISKAIREDTLDCVRKVEPASHPHADRGMNTALHPHFAVGARSRDYTYLSLIYVQLELNRMK